MILLGFVDGEAGELHAEFGEFLEHFQVACGEFGGLQGGDGEGGVQEVCPGWSFLYWNMFWGGRQGFLLQGRAGGRARCGFALGQAADCLWPGAEWRLSGVTVG